MLKKYIILGHEMWLTEKTANGILKELQELEDEHQAWLNVQRAYQIACESNDPMDWSIYSDVFKDYWGVRPHW